VADACWLRILIEEACRVVASRGTGQLFVQPGRRTPASSVTIACHVVVRADAQIGEGCGVACDPGPSTSNGGGNIARQACLTTIRRLAAGSAALARRGVGVTVDFVEAQIELLVARTDWRRRQHAGIERGIAEAFSVGSARLQGRAIATIILAVSGVAL
jgi:hypothetical protein